MHCIIVLIQVDYFQLQSAFSLFKKIAIWLVSSAHSLYESIWITEQDCRTRTSLGNDSQLFQSTYYVEHCLCLQQLRGISALLPVVYNQPIILTR